MKQILDIGLDYISSEESGDDQITLYRRPLSWMKPKYSSSMRLLDQIYYEGLSAKSKGMVRNREDGETSEKPVPRNPLEFVVKESDHESPLDTSNVSTDMEH